MLLGQARGKVGSLVFSRVDGKQVTRSRAEVVRNPKTTNQIMQRVLLNTVSQAYSLMQPIVDHSFEGLTPGQKTMSKFMSENVKELRMRISDAIAGQQDLYAEKAFTPIGMSVFSPNAYVIAKGSLNSVIPTHVTMDDKTVAAIEVSGNTYQDVIGSLGAKKGDQLTFIQVCLVNEKPVFYYSRVILDPMDDGESADLSSDFITGGEINFPNSRNDGGFGTLVYEDNKIGFILPLAASAAANVVASAVIVSRKGTEGWKRSDTSLVVNSAIAATIGISFGDAVDMGVAGYTSLSDYYLNNAGQGNLANFNQGSSSSQPRLMNVTVNGVRIAAANTTTIAESAAATLVFEGNSHTDGMYAAYKIGEGDWSTPVALNSHVAQINNVALSPGDEVQFSIGYYEAMNYSPASIYRGVAVVMGTAISAISVNGTAIANSGSTQVNENANSSIAFATQMANGMVASYKIGSGAWASPVNIVANAAQFTGVNLQDGDNVTFAIGVAGGSFSPSKTYGGTAMVSALPIQWDDVDVNGTAIGASGSTNVVENANSTITIQATNASGKYAAYKIGSGSWSTPVLIASDTAQFTGVALAENDVVSFAIGTGNTPQTFTAKSTYGGTATVVETPPIEFANVQYNGSPWTANKTVDGMPSGTRVAGNIQNIGKTVVMTTQTNAPSIGANVSAMVNLATVGSNGNFDINMNSGISSGTVYLVCGQLHVDGEGNYVTVEQVYPYYVEVVMM